MNQTNASVKTEEVLDDAPDTVKSDLRKFNKAEDQVNKAIAALNTITFIKTQEDCNVALDIIKRAKQVEKIIEEKRTSLVKPYNDEVKRINTFAKEMAGKIPPAIKIASDAVLLYNRKLELERLKARTASRITCLTLMKFEKNTEEEVWSKMVFKGIEVERSWIENYDDLQWEILFSRTAEAIIKKNDEERKVLEDAKQADAFFGEETSAVTQKAIDALQPTTIPINKPVPSFGPSKVKGVTKIWAFEIENALLIPREYLVVDESKIREAMRDGVRTIPGVKFYQKETLTSR